MFQGMGVIGIEEDQVVELRAQAGDHGDETAGATGVVVALEAISVCLLDDFGI
jgi:hypothetical protein